MTKCTGCNKPDRPIGAGSNASSTAHQVNHPDSWTPEALWRVLVDQDKRIKALEARPALDLSRPITATPALGPSPLQSQREWEREFALHQPDGVTCQVEDCTGHTNWGWCSVHTPLHYRELS